jgi:hypothetical protein
VAGIAGTEAVFNSTPWGALAYNRMKPTKPSFQVLNFLAEMRDLPHVLKQRFHFNNLKELGNFHLAAQFGWLSLLRDTQKFVQTQSVLQKRLLWLLKHNGKPVRRKVILSEINSDPVISSGQAYGVLQPVLVTQYYARQPTWQLKTWTSSKIWASAQFRYWLPDGPRNIEWTKKMMYRIFGFQPSPSVVYNAMPWTRLIDYFANLGDLIENLEPGVADRLAADYYYLMAETSTNKVQDSVGYFVDPEGNPFTASATATVTRFRKTRVQGDPFGMNTAQNSLSGMQLSILGALGIARLL